MSAEKTPLTLAVFGGNGEAFAVLRWPDGRTCYKSHFKDTREQAEACAVSWLRRHSRQFVFGGKAPEAQGRGKDGGR